MPDTPDPDPLTKLIGVLRTAVDDLAGLAEHPTVKGVVSSLINALGSSDSAAPTTKSGRGANRPASSTASKPKANPAARSRPAERRKTGPATGRQAGSRKPRGAATSAPRSGGRRDELLGIITRRPGVSISDAAKQVGVAPGGLYRIARALESDGLIRKEGTGWHPAG